MCKQSLSHTLYPTVCSLSLPKSAMQAVHGADMSPWNAFSATPSNFSLKGTMWSLLCLTTMALPALGPFQTLLRARHMKRDAPSNARWRSYLTKKQRGVENRFLPYFSMHEFEALLFVSPPLLAATLDLAEEEIHAITSAFSCVEDINCSKMTAPSKRLEALCQGRTGRRYNKVVHGPSLAGNIGIDHLREACPHFDFWLSSLERLA